MTYKSSLLLLNLALFVCVGTSAADRQFDTSSCAFMAANPSYGEEFHSYDMVGTCNDGGSFSLHVRYSLSTGRVSETFASDEYGNRRLTATCRYDPVIHPGNCWDVRSDGEPHINGNRLVSRDVLAEDQKAGLRSELASLVSPPAIENPVDGSFFGTDQQLDGGLYRVPVKIRFNSSAFQSKAVLLKVSDSSPGEGEIEEVLSNWISDEEMELSADENIYESAFMLSSGGIYIVRASFGFRGLDIESLVGFVIGDKTKMNEALLAQARAKVVAVSKRDAMAEPTPVVPKTARQSKSDVFGVRVKTGVIVERIDQRKETFRAGEPIDLMIWFRNTGSAASDAGLRYAVRCEVRAGQGECPVRNETHDVGAAIGAGEQHPVKLSGKDTTAGLYDITVSAPVPDRGKAFTGNRVKKRIEVIASDRPAGRSQSRAMRERPSRKVTPVEKSPATPARLPAQRAPAVQGMTPSSRIEAQPVKAGPIIESAFTVPLGALRPHTRLYLKGKHFGTGPGRILLYGDNQGPVALEDLNWTDQENINGVVPQLTQDWPNQTAYIKIETADLRLSNPYKLGLIVREERILDSDDVVVEQCGDDGNKNRCNHVVTSDGMTDLGNAGLCRIGSTSDAAVIGFHSNNWGALEDDSGTDRYSITLENGWYFKNIEIFKDASKWNEVYLNGPVPRFPVGRTNWVTEYSWKVTPNDFVCYALKIVVEGPAGTDYK